MRNAFAIWIVFLFYCNGFSQLPLNRVLPMGVIGIAYGDTLMNTNGILKREGIRKITSTQSSPEATKTFWSITTFLNQNGKVATAISCMRRSKAGDTSFCLSDSFFYDASDRMLEFRSRDAKGNGYLECQTEYGTGGKVKQTWISTVPQTAVSDTSISYEYFNEQGQLVRLEHEGKKFRFQNGSLYYHADGLLDSIHHDDHTIGTYIFKRQEKRKTRILMLENPTYRFRWVYNSSGQCISSEWQSKNRSPNYRNASVGNVYKAESVYYYNANGTLSKVVINQNGKKTSSVSYSYEQ